ncbi:MAG: phospholipase D-like domain-containing protein [Actinomycetota bacterium]
MGEDFQVVGKNAAAQFTLKVHRGDGMCLLAMDWRKGRPPKDFVGFAIEYREPGGDRFLRVWNRLAFLGPGGKVNTKGAPTRDAPIQKFRWVHFPFRADLPGPFRYRVTPVFMDEEDNLGYGETQEADIELRRETYPGRLNVAFTRGFVSSQAFVRHFDQAPVSTLIPGKAATGLRFTPTHPRRKDALPWMGFEARRAILDALDQALQDKQSKVRVVAYDLNEPEIVSRLEKLGKRLMIIIDDEGKKDETGKHAYRESAESQAERALTKTAGAKNVKRQHMGKLQHNKTIVVDGPKVQMVVCGSTNFSWRGLYVQANNAMILHGKTAVKLFSVAFDDYWHNGTVAAFGGTASAQMNDLKLKDINARVAFSPHAADNALLDKIAKDIRATKSSLFYSLAFLYQTKGAIRSAIKQATKDKKIFVYGMSDRKVGGLDIQKPDGNVAPVYPAALEKEVPVPFKAEPTGGGGNRMHHKFVVIDFDKPSARVYLGSYNFSQPADTSNGENLLVIRDRRVAVSYMVEAIRLFDHYHFRVARRESKKSKAPLALKKPPRTSKEVPWWLGDYTDPRKIRDRELFR